MVGQGCHHGATAPEPMRPAKFFLMKSSKHQQQYYMWLQFWTFAQAQQELVSSLELSGTMELW